MGELPRNMPSCDISEHSFDTTFRVWFRGSLLANNFPSAASDATLSILEFLSRNVEANEKSELH